MDFHIRLGTAHRRLARPAHPSCPHLGDERPKLPARHQQEGPAAIGSGAKPKKPKYKTKESPSPSFKSTQKHNHKLGLQSPFLSTRLVQYLAAIWHILSPSLTPLGCKESEQRA